MVNPACVGRLVEALDLLEALGVTEVPFDGAAATRLARLRAESGAKMPDSCALLVTQQTGADLASFDERLRRAAASLGITALP